MSQPPTTPIRAHLVTPSYPATEVPRDAVLSALAELGVRVSDWPPHRALGHLAGTDADRVDELHHAVSRDDVDVVWALRGGYGSLRLLPRLDARAAHASRPKVLVGFSDTSALLSWWAEVLGWPSVHAPTAAWLADHPLPPRGRALLTALLRGASPTQRWPVRVVRGTPPTGTRPLVGGNLTVLSAAAGMGELVTPRGALVVLEGVDEPVHAVDRHLSVLVGSGALSSAGGVVLGSVDTVPATSGQPTLPVEQVAADVAGAAGLPVLAGAPVGHCRRTRPFRWGQPARLRGETGVAELQLLNPSAA